MPVDVLGGGQAAALVVLVQRGFEEVYSQRNARRLFAEGWREAGREYYPVVAVLHLSWLAAVFLLVPASAASSGQCSWHILRCRSSDTVSSHRSGATGRTAS